MEENKNINPDNRSAVSNLNTDSGNAGEPNGKAPERKPAVPDEPPEHNPENIPDAVPETHPGEVPTENPGSTGDVKGPEINLPGSGAPRPDIGLPPRPQGPHITDSTAAEQHTGTYRWTYGDELRRDTKRRRPSGVLIYAIIMTFAFAIALTLLLGVVLYENGKLNLGNIRTIFVRDLDENSGVLTIPEIAVKVKPSVVGITVSYEGGIGTGVGTGIIMTKDGYIATNYHVIEGGVSYLVTTGEGVEYPAEVVGYDELSDLAVIKINADGLTAAEFGDSDQLIVGELVVAIGTPAGLDYAETVTDGIVSAINRDVKIYDESGILVKRMVLIQTNASVNPGNSGGPLINQYGKVIGIISMKLANDYVGIGFAIPSNGALTILNEIIATGSSGSSSLIAQKRAIIGITAGGIEEGGTVTLDDGRTVTAAISGVIVTAVNQNLDAAGKLSPGDIITEVDGKSVFSVTDVMDIVNKKYVGDSVSIKFYRDGAYYTVSVKLSAMQ